MQVTTVDPHGPGIGRRARGTGWSYFDRESGAVVRDPSHLDRIHAIVIPPAWTDVWICWDPAGHIQAVGSDAAGRRQYRYHAEWTRQRSEEKFRRVAELGGILPTVREELAGRLASDGLGRTRVMAGSVWMLDLGVFRVGGEEYATGDDASFGLATLRRDHATARRDGSVEFRYTAKAGVARRMTIAEPSTHRLVSSLKRRRGGGDDLLAWRRGRGGGATWHDVTADDVNDAVRELVGERFTAKDLRTWNAGVVAAVSLAREVSGGSVPSSQRASRSAVTRTMKAVAEQLGNTPAVCRSSYVDPRLVEQFEQGRTVIDAVRDAPAGSAEMRGRIERGVLDLLDAA